MNSYAKALLDIAEKHHSVDEIAYQFDELNDTIFNNRQWLKMMNSPMVSYEQKYKNIEELSLNEHLATMLKMLAKTNQMGLYDKIYPAWVRMIRSKNNVAHINVYSVKDLTEEQVQKLTKKLKPRFKGMTIEIHVKVREHLIGGLRLIYQGQSLDNSIAHELDELYLTV
jgi:F-type H+-transporting ATPase subunit delta